MIKKADFDQKGAVRQIPNTGVCLQAKQTVLRGPGGGGGGPWITVFSWNPWTLKGTEKRSYLWLRRSDRTKFSWWTWTWFYSKPMKDMSRLYYEKAETNKTKLLWGKWEVFNKSDIEVDYWMFSSRTCCRTVLLHVTKNSVADKIKAIDKSVDLSWMLSI